MRESFKGPSRREVLAGALLGAGAISLGVGPRFARAAGRKRVLRVAHLTDIHVQPERKAGEGMAAALRHMQSLPDKPELVLTGGDQVMDSFAADEARTKTQWELWRKVLKDECGLPLEHCLGNHDIWGWARKESRTDGSEARWGKKWAAEQFGVERLYRSFDRAGWHFVVLDSVQPQGDGYTAKLDEEQLAWLGDDLKKVAGKAPVLVLSHIPILSAAILMTQQVDEKGDRRVSGSLVHRDGREIKKLFARHPNVKVCVSGHLHLVDRVDYCGVTYLCNGAVSGAWWKGKNHDFSEGYGVINLYDDGTFENEYVTYGWKAVT